MYIKNKKRKIKIKKDRNCQSKHLLKMTVNNECLAFGHVNSFILFLFFSFSFIIIIIIIIIIQENKTKNKQTENVKN